jgi:hypothetical protein
MAELQRGADLIARGQLEVCIMWLPVSLAIILVCYLDIGGFSSFIIVIPLFLVIGICMCCIFCTLCCVSSVNVDAMSDSVFDHSRSAEAPDDNIYSESRSSNYYSETDSLLRKTSRGAARQQQQQASAAGTSSSTVYSSASNTSKPRAETPNRNKVDID